MSTQPSQRAHVQALGKTIASQLFMVLRSIKFHDAYNKTVLVATERLKDTLNNVFGVLGVVKLEFIEDQFYLGDHRVTLDGSSQDNVKELSQAFKKRNLGGFTFTRPLNTKSLTELLIAFTEAEDVADDVHAYLRDRIGDLRDLAVELVGRRAYLEEEVDQPEIEIDPRLLALQLYAKAIIAVKRFVTNLVDDDDQKKEKQLNLIRIVQDLVDLASERANLLLKLMAIKNCMDYQYNHAVNVCVLSLSVGRALGLGRADLVDLGMAALMSDLGFFMVSPKLLDKAGELDESERAELREHTLAAVKVLLGKGRLLRGAMRRLIVAFQHHIHFDLKGGYPELEEKRPLHLFSRIVAVCDNFDALTTNRPWREAYSPDEALKLLREGAGSKFDPLITQVFINLVGLYPVGTVVQLNSGEVGIVYHTSDDPKSFERPFVRILREADGRPRTRTLIRNLMEQEGGQFRWSIVRTLEPDAGESGDRGMVFSA